MDTFQLKLINSHLAATYGKHSDGRVKWRLIENKESYTERRFGTFGKFDVHGNKLGEVDEVREVPKYNYIPYGIYILEQLYFTPILPRELDLAILSNNGNYEPRWSFMDNDMKYMEPTIDGCVFLITCVQTINKKVKKDEEERANVRKKADIEKLSEGDPAFIGPMISVPKNYGSPN